MKIQDELPDGSNFSAMLVTQLSENQVAALFEGDEWRVRKSSLTGFEVRTNWAELMIDSTLPILMHGPVADVERNVDHILNVLQAGGIAFKGECYDEDPGVVPREFSWPNHS